MSSEELSVEQFNALAAAERLGAEVMQSEYARLGDLATVRRYILNSAPRELERLQAENERLRGLLSGAVVYDTDAASSDQEVRKRLVEMGWTPPENRYE